MSADTPLIIPASPPARQPDALAGVLWMLLSCALLAGVAALGRYAALAGMPPFQIVFLRLVFAVIAISPVLAWRGGEMLRTRHVGSYMLRVVLGLVGMTTWFWALAYLPVGEVTAIGFLTPLFATVGAALILGEIVRWRRWTATLVGFSGALIILRPGMAEVGIGTWLALVAAIAMAAATLMIKRLSDRDDSEKVVLISLLMQTPLAAIPAMFVWQWPSLELWLVLAAMGAVGMLGHITLSRAFRAADASLVMGADFARLPIAVLFGYVLFGELIDLWTWVGAAVIFGASLYNARRERQVRRPVRAAGPHAAGSAGIER
ncbi:MAG TPA: DMT family transporter [Thermohalobaculum sp.]|nr:DMT family transporter [Thermohalobaculum sp.]